MLLCFISFMYFYKSYAISFLFTHALLGLGASLFTIVLSKPEELPATRPEMKPIDATSSDSITLIAMLIPNLGLPQVFESQFWGNSNIL